ncbi:MAG: glycosyltransferase family 4 protein [Alphaproteobacteria bacterium]|nr:glycosyltransferase family 4 protein [Alphaproteobacteria bacterium]
MSRTADTRRTDPPLKALARNAYRAANGIRARVLGHAAAPGDAPAVWYGGARAGDTGGPLVKVARLQAAFPEARGRFNLLYSLSNTPYLPRPALARLKARGVGIVHNQNGVFYPGWYGGDWKAQNARMADAYQLADHVFWQSAFCRDCADEFLGARDGPGEVLFNAVDVTVFSPAPEPATGSRPFRFLLTGKIEGHLAYRLEDTIAGLAAARSGGLDGELVVGGVLDEAARAAAADAADRHGVRDRVRLAGPYTQADAPALYRSADAYVMTKHADPCPNTVIEAMACGLPVAYVASGGVPELVGPDAGSGVVPDGGDDWSRPFRPDADALGAAMTRVAENHAALSAAARARAEEAFDLRTWLDRHRKVFDSLIERT